MQDSSVSVDSFAGHVHEFFRRGGKVHHDSRSLSTKVSLDNAPCVPGPDRDFSLLIVKPNILFKEPHRLGVGVKSVNHNVTPPLRYQNGERSDSSEHVNHELPGPYRLGYSLMLCG